MIKDDDDVMHLDIQWYLEFFQVMGSHSSDQDQNSGSLSYGVSLGSILGPLPFLMHLLPLYSILRKLSIFPFTALQTRVRSSHEDQIVVLLKEKYLKHV